MNQADLSEIWNEVLNEVRTSSEMDPATYNNWLAKTSLYRIEDGTAWICCPSRISRSIIRQQQAAFESSLTQNANMPLKIYLTDTREVESFPQAEEVQTRTNQLLNAQFRSEYTFNSFVEGTSNREAFAACYNCCTQTGIHLFNPIMIYGNSGLGKTHLLHAVGNYLREKRPEVKVIYMYAGAFVDLLIDAMKTRTPQGNTVEQVKAQLTDCDYFLLDDIQNLRNSSSQEIFFAVYNELIAKNTQIIITSDIHPQELSGLQSRLISRFTSGLAVSVSRPEFDTSRAILRKRIEGKEEEIRIQDDVIDYLAKTFSNDVRNLEGSLNRLIFSATLEDPDVIDLEFARKVLSNEPLIDKQKELSVKKIKKAVAQFYGLSYSDLEGKSRQKAIVNARHICIYLSRELLHISYSQIGMEFGGRDHKTVASSLDRSETLLQKDAAFRLAVEKIRSSLQ